MNDQEEFSFVNWVELVSDFVKNKCFTWPTEEDHEQEE
tara:strand:- start:484 stop:597 length:114 start_codon:yes stop_codon:yes gene_type:complete